MGYTHYFSYHPDSEPFRWMWPQMRRDTERILDYVESIGIQLGRDPYNGTLPPEYEVIAFNGSMDDDDLDGEPLVLALRFPAHRRRARNGRLINFCKTGRRPYDLAVAATLLRCHRLLPDEFAIQSDGGWDREWRYGNTRPTPGLVSARDVVAELFGDHEIECPFDRDWAQEGTETDQP